MKKTALIAITAMMLGLGCGESAPAGTQSGSSSQDDGAADNGRSTTRKGGASCSSSRHCSTGFHCVHSKCELADHGDLAPHSQCNDDSDCQSGKTCVGQQADGSGDPCDPSEESGCLMTCERAETTNSCEAAGGTCVPLVPDACANGTVGDARTYSCGGGLGVQCCLPRAANCRAIVECVRGKHWDQTACACVDNDAQDGGPADGGAGDGGAADGGASDAGDPCGGCASGHYCSFCFGRFACIPDGALC